MQRKLTASFSPLHGLPLFCITCKKLLNRGSTVYKPCNQRISQAGRDLSSFCYLGKKTTSISLCDIVARLGLDSAKHGSLKIINVLIITSGIM